MRFPVLLVILAIGVSLALSAYGAPSSLRLTPAVPGCPVCDLWLQYEDVVLQAKQEVGRLEDGVFYFYHSDKPSVIEPLIRFAHERTQLTKRLGEDETLRKKLETSCGHRLRSGLVDVQTSTSARGILAVVTTQDHTIFTSLRDKAGEAVRAKLPFWF